jgi:hypothetical protein
MISFAHSLITYSSHLTFSFVWIKYLLLNICTEVCLAFGTWQLVVFEYFPLIPFPPRRRVPPTSSFPYSTHFPLCTLPSNPDVRIHQWCHDRTPNQLNQKGSSKLWLASPTSESRKFEAVARFPNQWIKEVRSCGSLHQTEQVSLNKFGLCIPTAVCIKNKLLCASKINCCVHKNKNE